MKKAKSLIILSTSLLLIGCAAEDIDISKAQATTGQGFEVISEQSIGGGALKQEAEVFVMKEKSTGCFYSMAKTDEGITMTQMYIKSGGGTYPYCNQE